MSTFGRIDRMKKVLAFLIVLFAAWGIGYGQAISVNGGSIQGTITDPTGAVVPGASITITGADTGSVKVLTTDSGGFYSIGPLIPGPYIVSVSAQGFRKLVGQDRGTHRNGDQRQLQN